MDQASLLRLLQAQNLGPDSGTWDPAMPQAQPMVPQGGVGVDIARALQAALAQMPPSRGRQGAGSALLRGAASGFSAASLGREGAKQEENDLRAKANAAGQSAYDRKIEKRDERRFQLTRDQMNRKPDAERIEDTPVSQEQAKAMGHPEWAGMTRRDIRLMQQGKDAKSGEVTPSTKASFINTLVDNMRSDPDVKDFNTVATNYRRVAKMAEMGNGVGDMAIIFSYMKVLDPTSVVRESEFKNAAEAIGRVEMLQNAPAWVLAGNKLTPKGRQWFLEASQRLFDAKRLDFANALRSYEAQGQEYGVRPELVTGRYRKYLDDAFMGIKREQPKAETPPAAQRTYPQAGRRVQ